MSLSPDDIAALEAGALGDAPQPAEAVPPVADDAPVPLAVDDAGEWRQAIAACVALASVPYPALSDVWTADTIGAVARAAVPVGRKYGIASLADVFTRWPELNLIIVAWPAVIGSRAAIQAAHAAKRAPVEAGAPVEVAPAPPAVPVEPPRAA